MEHIDIIDIDIKVKAKYKSSKTSICLYKRDLEDVNVLLESSELKLQTKHDLESKKTILTDKIHNVSNNISESFYIAETAGLIQIYKNILKKPEKISFTGKKSSKLKSSKTKIVNRFISIVLRYDPDILSTVDMSSLDNSNETVICSSCSNKKNFIIDGNLYICET